MRCIELRRRPSVNTIPDTPYRKPSTVAQGLRQSSKLGSIRLCVPNAPNQEEASRRFARRPQHQATDMGRTRNSHSHGRSEPVGVNACGIVESSQGTMQTSNVRWVARSGSSSGQMPRADRAVQEAAQQSRIQGHHRREERETPRKDEIE